jgi:hypothetical protein
MRRVAQALLLLTTLLAGYWAFRLAVLHRPLTARDLDGFQLSIVDVAYPEQPGFKVRITPDGQVEYRAITNRNESTTRRNQLSADEVARLRTLVKSFPALVGEYDTNLTTHSNVSLTIVRADGSLSSISLDHGARPAMVMAFVQRLNGILGAGWEIDF